MRILNKKLLKLWNWSSHIVYNRKILNITQDCQSTNKLLCDFDFFIFFEMCPQKLAPSNVLLRSIVCSQDNFKKLPYDNLKTC